VTPHPADRAKITIVATLAVTAWVLVTRGCDAANGQTYCIQPGVCEGVRPWRPSRTPRTYAAPEADQGGYDSRGMDATLAGRLKAIEDRVPAGTDKLAREEHIRLVMEHITAGEKADQSRDAAIRSAHDRVTSLEQATRENRDNLAAVAGAIGNTADAQSLQNIAEWEQRQDNAIAKNIQAIQAIQQTPTPTPAAIAESVARSDRLLAVVRDHTREVVKEAAPVAGSAAVHWALAAMGIAGGGGAGGLAGWLALRGVRRLLSRRDDGEDTAATTKEQPQPEARTPSAVATVSPADNAALKRCRDAKQILQDQNTAMRQRIAELQTELEQAKTQPREEPDHEALAEIERLKRQVEDYRVRIADVERQKRELVIGHTDSYRRAVEQAEEALHRKDPERWRNFIGPWRAMVDQYYSAIREREKTNASDSPIY